MLTDLFVHKTKLMWLVIRVVDTRRDRWRSEMTMRILSPNINIITMVKWGHFLCHRISCFVFLNHLLMYHWLVNPNQKKTWFARVIVHAGNWNCNQNRLKYMSHLYKATIQIWNQFLQWGPRFLWRNFRLYSIHWKKSHERGIWYHAALKKWLTTYAQST